MKRVRHSIERKQSIGHFRKRYREECSSAVRVKSNSEDTCAGAGSDEDRFCDLTADEESILLMKFAISDLSERRSAVEDEFD